MRPILKPFPARWSHFYQGVSDVGSEGKWEYQVGQCGVIITILLEYYASYSHTTVREQSLHHVNERNTISFSPSGEDRKYLKKRNVMVLVSSEFFRKGHYHGVTLSVCIADNNIFSKMILLSYLLRHSLLALLYQH